MMGEIPALQIQTSTPPHSATTASATTSLNSSSVTSPASTSDGPGISSATALRSVSVRATSATRRAAVRERVREQPAEPRPAPVITTRLSVTSPAAWERRPESPSAWPRLLFVPISTIPALRARVPVGSRAGVRRDDRVRSLRRGSADTVVASCQARSRRRSRTGRRDPIRGGTSGRSRRTSRRRTRAGRRDRVLFAMPRAGSRPKCATV